MYRIAFGIGVGEDRNGDPLDDLEARTAHALRVVADAFGGVIATRGQGAWLDPESGRLITEDGLILTADTSDNNRQSVHATANNTAEILRQIFYQNAIRVTILPIVVTWNRFKEPNLDHMAPTGPNIGETD